MVTDGSSGPQPVPWKVKDVAIATALVFAAFLLVLVLVGLVAARVGIEQRALLVPWLTGVLEGFMLAAVWVFAIRKYRVPWRALGLRLRYTQPRWGFALPWIALFGSLGFTALYSIVTARLGLKLLEPLPIPQELRGEGVTRVLNTLVIALWGPFTEEVFFRGFLLAALVPVMGAARGAAVSAAVFAVAHLQLGALIPIFVTGLLLAWLYLKTESLWPPITAHVAQNFIALTAAGLVEPGAAEQVGTAFALLGFG